MTEDEGRRSATLLGLCYFLIMLASLGKARLLGLDESIYSHVAKEAGVNGHWMPLVWGGGAFIKKPPLFLWLMGLAVKCFGPGEGALRLWSAVFGALGLAYTYRLGVRLLSSRMAAFFAAALLGLQDHYILYSRLATMDSGLTCAYLGVLWHSARALDPEAGPAASKKQLLWAGLWFAVAILFKSWFAFLLLPALLLTQPFQLFKARFFLPPLLALTFWLGLYSLEFGRAFWLHELGENVWMRMQGGAAFSASQGQDPLFTLKSYAALGISGLPFLWPLLPLGFVRAALKARSSLAAPEARLLLIFGATYCMVLVFFSAPLINYATPLLPLAALLGASALEAGGLAVVLALAGALLAGFWRKQDSDMPLILAGLSLLPLAVPRLRPPLLSRIFGLIFIALLAWQTLPYLRHPADPNRAMVDALLKHPARFENEPLLYLGEHTDARVLEYYSHYRVLSLDRVSKQRPKQAMLLRGPQGLVFYPALGGDKPLSPGEELAIEGLHPDPHRPVRQVKE